MKSQKRLRKRMLKRHYQKKLTDDEKVLFDAYLMNMLSIPKDEYDTFETIDKLTDEEYSKIITANFEQMKEDAKKKKVENETI